ncbi:hypothetical protein CPJCM30710_05050 [Clostridium polyendosporum]|uniref:DUF177 domain-containing protein n=1 Tax=Clostridium polyendosporum TaxID=69208 RepID=A0A919VDC4_9CLOT|nr:DUF177 domain-containing protein [Clostridium polyendosporum]GIM27839.1 hypothetical protein CPJCM30710_05050 [Clostridium polyendosporum]
MILQISDLLSKRERTKQVIYTFNMNELTFDGEVIKSLVPVTVNGILTVSADIVALDVDVTTDLELCCSRCLKNFSYPINIKVNEKFTNNKSTAENDDDIILADGDKLDITEIIVNNIISTLPIKRLCSESCKGLCQQCGTDLNTKRCSCDIGDVDIRLAKLKDLFANKEV